MFFYSFVHLFVCRLCCIAVTTKGPINGVPCFLPVKKLHREMCGCGGNLLVASINAPHLFNLLMLSFGYKDKMNRYAVS